MGTLNTQYYYEPVQTNDIGAFYFRAGVYNWGKMETLTAGNKRNAPKT